MLRAASLAALALLAAIVVACGGGAASGEADPASAVPADALVYMEAVVGPEGDLRDDAEAAAGKVLRTDDPGGTIRGFVDKTLASGGAEELTYDKDIKPWLGERMGFWMSGRSDAGVAVVAVTDPDAARDAIHKSADDTETKRSYNGVDYEINEDGEALAILGDFMVFGNEPELKRTIDAQKGDSLAESDRYRDGLDDLDDGRLGHFYLDLKRLLPVVMREEPDGEEQLRQLQALIPLDKLPPFFGAVLANGDRVAIDMVIKGQDSKALGALGNLGTGGETPLLKELPGDSWAAFGAPNYGEQLRAVFGQYAGLFGGEAAKEQLRNQFGIDIEEDVLSWIGDVALFVRGDKVTSLDGGAVIAVTDEGKAEKGFAKLVGLLQSSAGVSARPVKIDGAATAFAVSDPSIPKPIVLARGEKKVVVTYGQEAAVAALSPQSKLGDADVFEQAKDALEDLEPSLLVSMPAVVKLVDSSGSNDADWAKARPYLDAYDVIALGFEGNNNGGRVRFAAGLK